MFKSYLLSGYRNLIKQKLSSLINVMGLALAIGCCLVVFNFLEWVWNKDSFNPNRNEIYVAERSTEKNPSYKLWADTPAPLGVALQRKFPDIKAMARIEYLPAVIKRGNQLFEEELSFVDDSFHALFNFPVKWGTRADFTALGGIVLTEELSEKLYGSTNSVGNILSIRFVKDKKTYNARFTVKGVLAKKPTDASFGFRALIPISLEKEFSKVPQVDGAAGSAQPLGTAEDEIQMSIDGKIQAIKSLKVSPNYFGVMGIGFTQGKAPNQKVVADTSSSILVNEAFSKSMHWKNPVGRSVSFLHHPYHIVGEVRNFHYEAFLKAIEPLVIRFSSPGENRYMALRLRKSALARAPSIIGPVWKQLYPETPLDYYYQNEVFEGYFRGFEQLSEVLSAACLITVIIAVSGIFGLAFLILAKRTKEVAIRKLLGARISSLAILINKEFMISILVACALGVPLSLVLVNGLLKLISPESSMGIIPFIVAPLALIMITSLSVSWHIYKAGTAAPARNLRTQ